MKLFARPKSLNDAIGYWSTVSRLLGLRVFEYPRGQPWPVLSFVYLLVLFLLYCGTINLQTSYYMNNKLLKLEYVLYQLFTYINFVNVLIKLILGWWHTKVREQAQQIRIFSTVSPFLCFHSLGACRLSKSTVRECRRSMKRYDDLARRSPITENTL